jgi:hypothetical protein
MEPRELSRQSLLVLQGGGNTAGVAPVMGGRDSRLPHARDARPPPACQRRGSTRQRAVRRRTRHTKRRSAAASHKQTGPRWHQPGFSLFFPRRWRSVVDKRPVVFSLIAAEPAGLQRGGRERRKSRHACQDGVRFGVKLPVRAMVPNSRLLQEVAEAPAGMEVPASSFVELPGLCTLYIQCRQSSSQLPRSTLAAFPRVCSSVFCSSPPR